MTTLALIGEAWGVEEERARAPFVGPSGWHLTQMLEEAGIHRADCFLTNVFSLHPLANKLESLCGGKSEGISGYPALLKSKYIRREFEPELDRLAKELEDVNPNLVVCLGNTPLWALHGRTGVSKLRGSTCTSTHTISGFKLLPTYHPAAVIRDWSLRPIVIIDLMKAAREREFPEIRRPPREIWLEPTLEDLETFYERYILGCSILAIDIETSGRVITEIGFAPSHTTALVIPFVDARRANRSYWPDRKSETAAWYFVRRVLEDGGIKKVLQNATFDCAFLARAYGIMVRGVEHDTMLLSHAQQPESLKSLGFLGSIFTDEGAWKNMRKFNATIKRDD